MNVKIESTSDTPEQIAAVTGEQAKASDVEPKSAPASKEAGETTDESDTSEKETEKQDLSEDDDGEEQADGSKKKPDDDSKVPRGVKRKLDKLTARATREREEKEYWRAEALRNQQKSEEKQIPKEVVQASGQPEPENFETNAAYVAAVAKWTLEQTMKERDEQKKEDQSNADFQSKLSEHRSKVKAFVEKTPDFMDAIEDVDDVVLSPAIQMAILENGPEFQYELCKNREELERINALPAMQAARELGKFEARLAKEEKAEPKTEIKKTKAPPPLQPVSTRSSGVNKDPNTMSYREFKAWREAKT